jgi:hypothetical protein
MKKIFIILGKFNKNIIKKIFYIVHVNMYIIFNIIRNNNGYLLKIIQIYLLNVNCLKIIYNKMINQLEMNCYEIFFYKYK